MGRTSPGIDFVLFQFIHADRRTSVVLSEDVDEICDRQDSDKVLLGRVPQRGCTHSVRDEGEEGFLHEKLSVKNNEFRR